MPVFLMRVNRLATCSFVAGAFVALASSAADASPVVNFNISVLGGAGGPYNNAFSQNGDPTGLPPGVYNYHHILPHPPAPGPLLDPNGQWSIEWDFNADSDPTGAGGGTGAKIGSVFTVRNLRPDGALPGDNHLQFSILVNMNVMATTGATQFFGSGGVALNIDQSVNGHWGTVTAVNGPMWNYMINGTDVASLFNTGAQIGSSNGPTTASSSANLLVGQTGPLTGMHPTTMGIRLDFDLTPGETASFSGVFGLIPGPGGLPLLALALLASRRRRD